MVNIYVDFGSSTAPYMQKSSDSGQSYQEIGNV